MQLRCATWQANTRALGAIAMFTTGVITALAGPLPGKNDPPKPLPEEIVLAWKKAGADVCWLRVNRGGGFEFPPDAESVAGDLPAFRFYGWKEGLLANLPAPTAPFGLDLGHARVTDTAVKELASMKSLQALHLGALITDAELKELAGLPNLQSLILPSHRVTDAGLRHLAGLKRLQVRT